MKQNFLQNTLLIRLAAMAIFLTLCMVGIIFAKQILIPLVVAGLLAYIIYMSSETIERIPVVGKMLPTWLRYVLSVIGITLLFWIIWMIVTSNIAIITQKIPLYEQQLVSLMVQANDILNFDISTHLLRSLSNINLGSVAGKFFGSVATLGSHTVLIMIYTLFILIEFPFLKKKARILFQNHMQEKEQTKHMLTRMSHGVNTYFRIKTFASLLTALLCYVVLVLFGVDVPLFWALLVFLLNFIPTIGSVIAIIFPSVLALVQFASFGLFLVIIVLLVGVQLLVGNVIEPRIAGKSLNISPLVIIISLVISSALWGIVGMIISVPLVIILKIVTSEFPQTRLISLLLSRDGEITKV